MSPDDAKPTGPDEDTAEATLRALKEVQQRINIFIVYKTII